MSLAIDDSNRRRGHSRTRSRDDRLPDEAPRDKFADIREPSYIYPEDDLDDRYKSSSRRKGDSGGHPPYPPEGTLDSMLPGSHLYSKGYPEDAKPVYRTVSPPKDKKDLPYRDSKAKHKDEDSRLPGAFPEDVVSKRDSDNEKRTRYADDRDARYPASSRDKYGRDEPRVRISEPHEDKYDRGELSDDKLKFLPQKYSKRYEDPEEEIRAKTKKEIKKEREEEYLAYGKLPPPSSKDVARSQSSHSRSSSRDERQPYKYDDGYEDDYRRQPLSPRIEEPRYRYGEEATEDRRRKSDSRDDEYSSSKYRDSYKDDYKSSKTKDSSSDRRRYEPDRDEGDSKRSKHREETRERSSTLTVDSGSSHRERSKDRSRDYKRDKSPGPSSSLKVESSHHREKSRERSRDGRGSTRDKSPKSKNHRSTLSVEVVRPAGLSASAAPGSPMLESYYGTYQDCSPMPSPLLLASKTREDIKYVEPLSPLSDAEGKKLNRRARFHDGQDIASRLVSALKGNGSPQIEPLIEILPSLSHDQVMELRADYKQLVKTGSDRKGVNIAKHIRARLKDEDPHLMKACYAVALGQWESESYWANFWYQGDKTRRELLIESLMGHSNDEIHLIKEAFTDKKYDNSLVKCMKTELKEDKFKKAVLMVLEETRMEEIDYQGRRHPLDYKQVDEDVAELRKAIKAEKGGETLMISIVVQRSDSHLRAVLQEYEHQYRSNFAREALKKSGNLVGELLAHILNGVINRPVRDALLLNHALTASRKDGLRRELLISRLVRFHWDPLHMQDVKKAYRERYGQDLQDAVREATTGQWGLFCRELCIARMPNDVRRMERVEIIR